MHNVCAYRIIDNEFCVNNVEGMVYVLLYYAKNSIAQIAPLIDRMELLV